MIRTFLGGLVIPVVFFFFLYLSVYYSPHPEDAIGATRGSGAAEGVAQSEGGFWEWPTSERIERAELVFIVSYEKNWLGYHKAIVTDVLKSGEDLWHVPVVGAEFEEGSFHKTDSHDYGEGAVYFFYGDGQPVSEAYLHYAGSVLRDDEGTSLMELRAGPD